MASTEWLYLERHGYTWIQHPNGLYHGLFFTGEDNHLGWIDERGTLAHRSVRCGEYRYFLPVPEVEDA
jgi:hypothetical protein